MATENRESMVKPEFMSEEDWEMIKGQTASLDRIKGDAEADVEDYLANPDGRATGAGPSGLPTLLLTCIGRKSGEKRTTPLVFLQDGENMVVVASLAGYDRHPAWYLNLSAEPSVEVQVKADRFTANARTASAEEKAEIWPQMVEQWPAYNDYQAATEREIPIVLLERA